MIYKTRPGIVLIRICDVDVLAATRAVWGQCTSVRPLPRLWAGCWALMEKGRTSEEIISVFARLFQQPEDVTREKLEKIFRKLYEEGYLIEAVTEKETSEEKESESLSGYETEERHDAG